MQLCQDVIEVGRVDEHCQLFVDLLVFVEGSYQYLHAILLGSMNERLRLYLETTCNPAGLVHSLVQRRDLKTRFKRSKLGCKKDRCARAQCPDQLSAFERLAVYTRSHFSTSLKTCLSF